MTPPVGLCQEDQEPYVAEEPRRCLFRGLQ